MSNRPKILHISKYYPPYVGGIESVCRDFCKTLQPFAEQRVICFNTDKKYVNEVYDGINVTRVGALFTVASQTIAKKYGQELKKLIVDFKPDVIRLDYPNPFATYFLLKQIKKYKYTGKLQVFWHMDIIKQKFIENFFKGQIKKLIDRADEIIVTSPNYLENTSYLPNYVGKKKIVVLPLRVGDERLNISEESKEKAKTIKEQYKNKKIVFFFGRHVEYKGLEYLIDSNEYIDQNNVQIVIAGKGPLTEQLKEKAKKYSNIEFVGRLSDDDLNAYLLATDIFAFPSITRNEAFGISLAEALYFGKPAVTFHIEGSGVNYVSIDNETGLEAKNKDIKELANNINNLVHDGQLYKRLSIGAKHRADTLFTKEVFEKNVIDIYNDLLGIKL